MISKSNIKEAENKLQKLILNENATYLNDLDLNSKIFPQILIKMPKVLQIRLALNKHENISHFKSIAIPSVLFIDEDDCPIFCFRSDLKHFIPDPSRNNKKLKGLHHFKTKEFGNRMMESSFEGIKNTISANLNDESKNLDSSVLGKNNDKEKTQKSYKKFLEPNFSVEHANLQVERYFCYTSDLVYG